MPQHRKATLASIVATAPPRHPVQRAYRGRWPVRFPWRQCWHGVRWGRPSPSVKTAATGGLDCACAVPRVAMRTDTASANFIVIFLLQFNVRQSIFQTAHPTLKMARFVGFSATQFRRGLFVQPVAGPRGALDRVAQVAERKYCRSEARPFRPRFPRKVPVLPVCSPATL